MSSADSIENQRMGVWIDHREAILVVVSEDADDVIRIPSRVEWQLRRQEASPDSFQSGSQVQPADDHRLRAYDEHLARYYDNIAQHLQHARSILIMGPGEGKRELYKRLERVLRGARLITVETAARMSEAEVVQKVQQHYFPQVPRRPWRPANAFRGQ